MVKPQDVGLSSYLGPDVSLAYWSFGSKLPTPTQSKAHRCCFAAPSRHLGDKPRLRRINHHSGLIRMMGCACFTPNTFCLTIYTQAGYLPSLLAEQHARVYTPRFCISTFTLQHIALGLLSVDRFTFSPSHFQQLTKICVYFGLFSTSSRHLLTSLGGHICPRGGHACPLRPAKPAPWWLKGESRSAKPRCIEYSKSKWG